MHWIPKQTGGLAYAKEMKEQHHQLVLGIAHRQGQYGLRTKVEAMDELRAQMGLSLRPNLQMKGIPIDASVDFVKNLLEQIGWEACPVEDPKRIRKGLSEWLLHAKAAPKNSVYHASFEEVTLQVEILSLGRSGASHSPMSRQKTVQASKTWGGSVKPGIFRMVQAEQETPDIFWENDSSDESVQEGQDEGKHSSEDDEQMGAPQPSQETNPRGR